MGLVYDFALRIRERRRENHGEGESACTPEGHTSSVIDGRLTANGRPRPIGVAIDAPLLEPMPFTRLGEEGEDFDPRDQICAKRFSNGFQGEGDAEVEFPFIVARRIHSMPMFV